MRELPTGTVTLLFTDIEGSTKLLHELGDAYADVLAEHHRLLREAFTRHAGTEVDTQGDAFFYAFMRASDGLAAAGAGQQALAGGPVRVRMGLHTGEPILTEEGYVGIDVHRAARVMSAGHGGQVLLSEATAQLVDSSALRDLGEHRLKDMTAPQHLYQLGDIGFPPLKTLDATNLPVAASPLLGRESEVGDLVALLSNGSRLVTVTGPGGTGKTRVALQVASELVGGFRDGVFWVPLASLTDTGLVLPAIGEALGLGSTVSDALRDRELLLLLDNTEHLPAVAPVIAGILAGAPRLRALVTSRAPLHVSGEHEYPLEPLAERAAVELFCERARAIGRQILPDSVVAEICRRLDGLPLAIELAAARTKLLDPETLLGRLEQRLPILTGGHRDAPKRQQTLRATIEWSYDLLEEEAQRLFGRLAVFTGGFALDAAEGICDADLDSLSMLVDMSLLKPSNNGRLLMLETIREYAAELLRESGEYEAIARRHAAWYAALAEEIDAASLMPGSGADAGARRDSDQANLRAAVTWARDTGDEGLQLRIMTSVSDLFLRGSQREFRDQLERALAGGVDDVRLCGRGEALLSFTAYRQGDYPAARAAAERALDLAEAAADLRTVASSLAYLANVATAEGRFEEAERLFEEGADVCRAMGDIRGIAVSLVNLGDLALARGAYERAIELLLESVELGRPFGDRRLIWTGNVNLATAYVQLDRLPQAQARASEALRIVQALDDLVGITVALRVFAAIAVRRGEAERCVRLIGTTERIREEIELSLEPSEQILYDDVLERVGRLLESNQFAAFAAAGRGLSVAEAIAEALLEG